MGSPPCPEGGSCEPGWRMRGSEGSEGSEGSSRLRALLEGSHQWVWHYNSYP